MCLGQDALGPRGRAQSRLNSRSMSSQATAHLHAQHADGHAHIGLGETSDLLVALGLLRLRQWVLCGCRWVLPRRWSVGGVAEVLVGREIDFLRKFRCPLGRLQVGGGGDCRLMRCGTTC